MSKMKKPRIDWTEIFLRSLILTIGVPLVVFLAVITRGVLPILFVSCLAFSYGYAKWKQHRGRAWYD